MLSGPKANASVSIGGATTRAKIPIELVQQFECDPGSPDCDVADGTAASYVKSGVHGFLGVGLRSDPDGLVSPLAMLANGFILDTGGFASSKGTLMLGIGGEDGFTDIALQRAGSLVTGGPAWADDAVDLCYQVDGVDTVPGCTPAVFDTGSNYDVLYATDLADLTTNDGVLSPGTSLDVSADGTDGFGISFTVGTEVSRNAVMVDTSEPFTLFGIDVFLRYAVRYDIDNGRIGFRAYTAAP